MQRPSYTQISTVAISNHYSRRTQFQQSWYCCFCGVPRFWLLGFSVHLGWKGYRTSFSINPHWRACHSITGPIQSFHILENWSVNGCASWRHSWYITTNTMAPSPNYSDIDNAVIHRVRQRTSKACDRCRIKKAKVTSRENLFLVGQSANNACSVMAKSHVTDAVPTTLFVHLVIRERFLTRPTPKGKHHFQ